MYEGPNGFSFKVNQSVSDTVVVADRDEELHFKETQEQTGYFPEFSGGEFVLYVAERLSLWEAL